MLKSYSAEISGTQLIWIDKPPQNLKSQPVLVVIKNTAAQTVVAQPYRLADLVGRLSWQDDAMLAQREQRDAW